MSFLKLVTATPLFHLTWKNVKVGETIVIIYTGLAIIVNIDVYEFIREVYIYKWFSTDKLIIINKHDIR